MVTCENVVLSCLYEKKDGKLGIADEEEEEYEDEEEVPEFKYEEKLPVGIDSHLNLYQYETFCCIRIIINFYIFNPCFKHL